MVFDLDLRNCGNYPHENLGECNSDSGSAVAQNSLEHYPYKNLGGNNCDSGSTVAQNSFGNYPYKNRPKNLAGHSYHSGITFVAQSSL